MLNLMEHGFTNSNMHHLMLNGQYFHIFNILQFQLPCYMFPANTRNVLVCCWHPIQPQPNAFMLA